MSGVLRCLLALLCIACTDASGTIEDTLAHLSFVVCEEGRNTLAWVDRGMEAVTMVKSALVSSTQPHQLRFHALADPPMALYLKRELSAFLPSSKFNVYSLDDGVTTLESNSTIAHSSAEWKYWSSMIEPGKPCAGVKLLLPLLLPSWQPTLTAAAAVPPRNSVRPPASAISSGVGAVMHVDTDVVFLRDPLLLWRQLASFNSSHIAGVVAEHHRTTPASLIHYKLSGNDSSCCSNDDDTSCMSSAKHRRRPLAPFYGKYGLNSGVLLLNLTRMRNLRFSTVDTGHSTTDGRASASVGVDAHQSEKSGSGVWLSLVRGYRTAYGHLFRYGDQDLYNSIFAHHPHLLYLLPCRFNYRSDHCYMRQHSRSRGMGNKGGSSAEGAQIGDAVEPESCLRDDDKSSAGDGGSDGGGDGTARASGGIVVLHGARKAFHVFRDAEQKMPASSVPKKRPIGFRGMYERFAAMQLPMLNAPAAAKMGVVEATKQHRKENKGKRSRRKRGRKSAADQLAGMRLRFIRQWVSGEQPSPAIAHHDGVGTRKTLVSSRDSEAHTPDCHADITQTLVDVAGTIAIGTATCEEATSDAEVDFY